MNTIENKSMPGYSKYVTRMGLNSLLLVASLWLMPNIAMAGSLTVSWTANTEADLAGYKIYYGTASNTYGTPIDVGKVSTYVVSGLTENRTYYFALTAYDNAGNESAKSAEAFGTVTDNTPPAVPTGVTVR